MDSDEKDLKGVEAVSLAALNAYATDLEKMLLLRTFPIAIRMLKSESEIPEGGLGNI